MAQGNQIDQRNQMNQMNKSDERNERDAKLVYLVEPRVRASKDSDARRARQAERAASA